MASRGRPAPAAAQLGRLMADSSLLRSPPCTQSNPVMVRAPVTIAAETNITSGFCHKRASAAGPAGTRTGRCDDGLFFVCVCDAVHPKTTLARSSFQALFRGCAGHLSHLLWGPSRSREPAAPFCAKQTLPTCNFNGNVHLMVRVAGANITARWLIELSISASACSASSAPACAQRGTGRLGSRRGRSRSCVHPESATPEN